MPFIVPTAYLMYKIKNLQAIKPQLRVNFLKNFYYSRIISYTGIFTAINFYSIIV